MREKRRHGDNEEGESITSMSTQILYRSDRDADRHCPRSGHYNNIVNLGEKKKSAQLVETEIINISGT